MGKSNLKRLCLTLSLLSSAVSVFAQQDALISVEMMSRAQADIAGMNERELAFLNRLLVDCDFIRPVTSPQAQSTCQPVRERYRIEYGRDRGIDDVLLLLMIATHAQSGKSIVAYRGTFPGQIRQEDVMRAMTPGDVAAHRIIEVERTLRSAVTEGIRTKRAQ